MAAIKKSIYMDDNNSCAMDRGTLAKVNNSTTALAGSNPISIPGPILAGSTTLRLDGVSGSVGAIGYRFSANIFNLGPD